ncbi:hypothetical protein GCM10010415_70850 [Streptomyces atrovirens]|uniref:Integral membrane protein n=1 Tax=Streptomyces atrovirens TaxID=285556 RepID=A0ABW0DYK0_9ACTN
MSAPGLKRRPMAVVAGCGMLAASAGDSAQGYDGPGPFVFLAVGLAVLLAPWRPAPLLATVTAAFFLTGAVANTEDLTTTVDTGGLLATVGVVLQLAGFVVAVVAGVLAVRGPRGEGPVPVPRSGPHP